MFKLWDRFCTLLVNRLKESCLELIYNIKKYKRGNAKMIIAYLWGRELNQTKLALPWVNSEYSPLCLFVCYASFGV